MRRATVFLPILLLLLAALTGAARTAPARLTVYVFLKPDCPISQAVTLPLRELHRQYAAQGVAFVGVFPDEALPAAELAEFRRKYQLPFVVQSDKKLVLTHRYGARITPEVVVTDAAGKVRYQGRIDDSYARIGQRRAVVRHHELADALAALSAGQPVAVPKTEAVGCLIE